MTKQKHRIRKTREKMKDNLTVFEKKDEKKKHENTECARQDKVRQIDTKLRQFEGNLILSCLVFWKFYAVSPEACLALPCLVLHCVVCCVRYLVLCCILLCCLLLSCLI
jgi:hypothetical protein